MKTACCLILLFVLLNACTSKQNNMTVQEKNKAFFTRALDDFFNKKDLSSADRSYQQLYTT
jgi:uncharacterized protein YcfL